MREPIAHHCTILSQCVSERWLQIYHFSRPSPSLDRISRQPAHFLNFNAGVDDTKQFQKVSNPSPYQFIIFSMKSLDRNSICYAFCRDKISGWKWILKRNRRGLSEHMICHMWQVKCVLLTSKWKIISLSVSACSKFNINRNQIWMLSSKVFFPSRFIDLFIFVYEWRKGKEIDEKKKQ